MNKHSRTFTPFTGAQITLKWNALALAQQRVVEMSQGITCSSWRKVSGKAWNKYVV